MAIKGGEEKAALHIMGGIPATEDRSTVTEMGTEIKDGTGDTPESTGSITDRPVTTENMVSITERLVITEKGGIAAGITDTAATRPVLRLDSEILSGFSGLLSMDVKHPAVSAENCFGADFSIFIFAYKMKIEEECQ